MLMPVIFPLHDAEPDNGIVHPAQRLIVPLVRHRFGERLNIDEIERGEFDVEMRDVRVTLRVCHERSPRGPTALRLVASAYLAGPSWQFLRHLQQGFTTREMGLK